MTMFATEEEQDTGMKITSFIRTILKSQHIENIFEDFQQGRTLARKTRHQLLYAFTSSLQFLDFENVYLCMKTFEEDNRFKD
jgi:hypothetical protein